MLRRQLTRLRRDSVTISASAARSNPSPRLRVAEHPPPPPPSSAFGTQYVPSLHVKPSPHAPALQGSVQIEGCSLHMFDWHSPSAVHAAPSAWSVGFGWPSSQAGWPALS